MKKTFVVMITIFIVAVSMVTIMLKAKQDDQKALKSINAEYEQYLGKEIYGTEVATIINKAMDNNENYHIPKDEQGYYINDGKYCIKIELNMVTIEKTFQMEQLYNAGLTEFVKNFNLIYFKCINIEYHKQTGRISRIVFNQLEQ